MLMKGKLDCLFSQNVCHGRFFLCVLLRMNWIMFWKKISPSCDSTRDSKPVTHVRSIGFEGVPTRDWYIFEFVRMRFKSNFRIDITGSLLVWMNDERKVKSPRPKNTSTVTIIYVIVKEPSSRRDWDSLALANISLDQLGKHTRWPNVSIHQGRSTLCRL
jgi:hypothetical protein